MIAEFSYLQILPEKKNSSKIYIQVNVPKFSPLHGIEDGVADGGKSSKLIVCKSPGVNIENPGDALCCIIRQSHFSCHCVKK
jgi:hypothetical protein